MSGSEAREQANAYDSIFADVPLRFDDGSVEWLPPHPSLRMLDDDVLEALDEYYADIEENYDRDENGEIKGPPFYKNGKRQPAKEIQVVKIVLGEGRYEELRKTKTVGGKRFSAKHVWQVWTGQGNRIADRAETDPKSDGGAHVLADESAPDRK